MWRPVVLVVSFALLALAFPMACLGSEAISPSILLLSPVWGTSLRLGEAVTIRAAIGGWTSLPADGRIAVELKKDEWQAYREVFVSDGPRSDAVLSGMIVSFDWEPSWAESVSGSGRSPLGAGAYLLRLTLSGSGCSAASGAIPLEVVPTTLSITSDEDLAAAGGVTGSGTADYPYIIEGLRLFAGGEEFCIEICNTTTYWIVRNCTMVGASEAAISIADVRHGWVGECVVEDSAAGVRVGSEAGDVTFCLNTFRRNGADAEGATRQCQWDDGYVGNWWDTYKGEDSTGDGIGETAHAVGERSADARDRFPLVEPYVGGETAPGAGKVRLELRYLVGESSEIACTLETRFDVELGWMTASTLATSTSRLREDVLGFGLGNLWHVRATVLEDNGTMTVNDVPFPYEGQDIGAATEWDAHRFGASPRATSGSEADYAAYAPIVFPVRWIGVGDEWRSTLRVDAASLGIAQGEALYEATYRLVALDEEATRRYASIAGEVTIQVAATEDDPLLGTLSYAGTGGLSFTSLVDVATGRLAHCEGELLLPVSVESSDGTQLMKMELAFSFEIAETAPGGDQRESRSETRFAYITLGMAELAELGEEHRSELLERIRGVLQSRIDDYGVADAAIVQADSSVIRVAVPDDTYSPELVTLLTQCGVLEFQRVIAVGKSQTESLSASSETQEVLRTRNGLSVVVDRRPLLTGAAISNAVVRTSSSATDLGSIHVALTFSQEGAEEFARVIKELGSGQTLAIVLDDVIQSYPVIRDSIVSAAREGWRAVQSTTTISGGNMTADEAKRLATVLRAGALPACLEVVEVVRSIDMP